MRALIQRVSNAKVEVDGATIGSIQQGLLVFLGVGPSDTEVQARQLSTKIAKLRIFSDSDGKMNLSLKDVQGEALVISQFTLYADARKGNRPSYTKAAKPDHANELYDYFSKQLELEDIQVAKGKFGADMNVSLLNQGPVTIWLDTDDLQKQP